MTYDVEIIRTSRKSIGIQINNDGKIIVRAPYFVSEREIKALLESKRAWLDRKLSKIKCDVPMLTEKEINTLKKRAKQYIPARVAYYSELTGIGYSQITIRCQKTRWGSCSDKGNLNFNCLLMLAPERVLDSVIVHELCHRREMNHSKRFYELVYSIMPDYDTNHRWLTENGPALMARYYR